MAGRIDGATTRRAGEGSESRKRRSPWLWLLIIPYPALLWVPFYNAVEPRILGFPFFYAYQIAFVLITAVITGFVFVVTD